MQFEDTILFASGKWTSVLSCTVVLQYNHLIMNGYFQVSRGGVCEARFLLGIVCPTWLRAVLNLPYVVAQLEAKF